MSTMCTDRRTDGNTERWTNTNRWTDRQIRKVGQTNGQMDGQFDRRTRGTDGQRDRVILSIQMTLSPNRAKLSLLAGLTYRTGWKVLKPTRQALRHG